MPSVTSHLSNTCTVPAPSTVLADSQFCSNNTAGVQYADKTANIHQHMHEQHHSVSVVNSSCRGAYSSLGYIGTSILLKHCRRWNGHQSYSRFGTIEVSLLHGIVPKSVSNIMCTISSQHTSYLSHQCRRWNGHQSYSVTGRTTVRDSVYTLYYFFFSTLYYFLFSRSESY